MFSQSLRAKLIVPFIAGALAITTMLAWYTYTSARQEVVDAMLSISEAKTNHAVSSMSFMFKSMSTILYNMVVDPHVTDLLHAAPPDEAAVAAAREKATDWMEIITRSNEYYRDISIVNTAGVCVAASNPGMVGKSYANELYVRKALDGLFYVGETSVGRVTKKLSVLMSGPIDVGDKIGGALILVNDYPNIVDYGQKSTYDSQVVFTSFLTPEGVFAAHKDKQLMGNASRRFPELYEKLAGVREHGGEVAYQLDGATYVGYAKVEPTTHWVVVTSGKESEVLASAYRMGVTVVGISALFLCLITFGVVRVASGVLNSMFSLITYAKAVSEGDLNRQLEATHRKDELGILHESLQRLVATLRSLLEEAQKASEMKGQFLANMSHEIRTPLNAITGMTHLILREQDLSARVRDFVEKIQVSSRLLFGLINDILDLSKVEAGMMALEHIPFDLHTVFTNALAIHQENAEAKSLLLRLDYSPKLPRRFIGDPLRIGQVLNNLLSNALKFTPAGSVIVLCEPGEAQGQSVPPPPQLAVGADPAREAPALPQAADAAAGMPWIEVRVSVADTGVGIAPEVMDRLFQPFTQADASITRKFGGTGLGLTISKHLVDLLGGAFTVTSDVNAGTCFTFTMHLVPDPNEEAAPHGLPGEAAQVRLDGRLLLVAEDNLINQMIMEELLSQMGATVRIANNGEEAVAAVRAESFDLVFMDMQMPVMDGLEATRQIRTFRPVNELPIIALTANAMKEDRIRCFACGMNAYITKPVEPAILASVIRDWLR